MSEVISNPVFVRDPMAAAAPRGRDAPAPEIIRDVAYPKKLTVVLTDRCNLKCFICQRDEYEEAIEGFGQHLDLANLGHLDGAIAAAETIDITGFGESFLHPQLGEFLDYIYARNPSDNLIAGITNGTALSAKNAALIRGHLRYLWISLNAANASAYRRDMHPESHGLDYSGKRDPRVRSLSADDTEAFTHAEVIAKHGSFARVLANIREFMAGIEEDERAKVNLHYVVHRKNYHEMADFVALAAELGVSQVNFNQYMVTKPDNVDYSIWWVKEDYNAALDRAQAEGRARGVQVVGRKFFDENERLYNKDIDCRSPYDEVLVGADGTVNPCCHIGAGGQMGDAYAHGFDAVWFGPEYRRLREERFKPGCLNCNLFLTYDDYRSHFHPYIKSTPQWKQISSHFVGPAEAPALEVLILGAGRDGSRSLSRAIADLYAANGRGGADVTHLPGDFPTLDRVLDYLRHGDAARLSDLFGRRGPHVLAAAGLGFAMPALAEVLGRGVKIIHLTREREACIDSLVGRLVMYPESWGGYVETDDNLLVARLIPYELMRPTAVDAGEMDVASWRGLSLRDRLGWYYDAIHRRISDGCDRFADVLEIRTEDLSDPATVRGVAAFIDPDWRSGAPPVHLGYSRYLELTDATIPLEDRRAVETVLAEFDLDEAAASLAYVAEYFAKAPALAAAAMAPRPLTKSSLRRARAAADASVASRGTEQADAGPAIAGELASAP